MNRLTETGGKPNTIYVFFSSLIEYSTMPGTIIHCFQCGSGMHFIVSWDVKSGGILSTEMNDAMIGSLYGYSWIRLLNAFYIVDIDSGQDWNIIQEKLLSAAQRYRGRNKFPDEPHLRL